jgi:hypothetical protein
MGSSQRLTVGEKRNSDWQSWWTTAAAGPVHSVALHSEIITNYKTSHLNITGSLLNGWKTQTVVQI